MHALGLPMTRQIKETLKFPQRSKVIQLHEKLWHFMLFIFLPCYFVYYSILVLLPKKLSLPMNERIYFLNWTENKEKQQLKLKSNFSSIKNIFSQYTEATTIYTLFFVISSDSRIQSERRERSVKYTKIIKKNITTQRTK